MTNVPPTSEGEEIRSVRSTRSTVTEFRTPLDDPERLLRNRNGNKPGPSSEKKDAPEPSPPLSHRNHWLQTEVLPNLKDWVTSELGKLVPELVGNIMDEWIDKTLPISVDNGVRRTLDLWSLANREENPLTVAVTRQVKEQLKELQPVRTADERDEHEVAPQIQKLIFRTEHDNQLPAVIGSASRALPMYLPVPEVAERNATPKGGGSVDGIEEEEAPPRSPLHSALRARARDPKRKTNKSRRQPDSDPSSSSSDEDRSDRDRKKRRGRRNKNRRKPKRREESSESESNSNSSETDYSDDSYAPRRSRKYKRSSLKPVRPLNDLFAIAVDYRTYRLRNRSQKYVSSTAKNMGKYHKRLDVQMKNHSFSGDDPIAVLGFLSRFRNACDKNDISEGAALWCLQFYLTGTAHSILESRLTGGTMAVDVDRTEMIHSYKEAVNFFLKTYATDEEIALAYNEVTSFHQSTNMSETEFSQKLWSRALRCGTVFSDRRMKSLFTEGLLPSTRAQVRNYLATRPTVDYQALTRYAEALGATYRSSNRSRNVEFKGSRTDIRKKSGKAVLATESSFEDSSESATVEGDGDAIMIVGNRSGPTRSTPTTYTSPPTSFYPSRPTTPVHQRAPPANPNGNYPTVVKPQSGNRCRLCLSTEHTVCPWLPIDVAQKLMAEREANYAARRESEAQYNRPPGYYRPYGSAQIARPKPHHGAVAAIEDPQPDCFETESQDDSPDQQNEGKDREEA